MVFPFRNFAQQLYVKYSVWFVIILRLNILLKVVNIIDLLANQLSVIVEQCTNEWMDPNTKTKNF